jgi:hypothetical protein
MPNHNIASLTMCVSDRTISNMKKHGASKQDIDFAIKTLWIQEM